MEPVGQPEVPAAPRIQGSAPATRRLVSEDQEMQSSRQVGRRPAQPLHAAATRLSGQTRLALRSAWACGPACPPGRQHPGYPLRQALHRDVLVAHQRAFILDRDPQRSLLQAQAPPELGGETGLQPFEAVSLEGQLGLRRGLVTVLAAGAAGPNGGPLGAPQEMGGDRFGVHRRAALKQASGHPSEGWRPGSAAGIMRNQQGMALGR